MEGLERAWQAQDEWMDEYRRNIGHDHVVPTTWHRRAVSARASAHEEDHGGAEEARIGDALDEVIGEWGGMVEWNGMACVKRGDRSVAQVGLIPCPLFLGPDPATCTPSLSPSPSPVRTAPLAPVPSTPVPDPTTTPSQPPCPDPPCPADLLSPEEREAVLQGRFVPHYSEHVPKIDIDHSGAGPNSRLRLVRGSTASLEPPPPTVPRPFSFDSRAKGETRLVT